MCDKPVGLLRWQRGENGKTVTSGQKASSHHPHWFEVLVDRFNRAVLQKHEAFQYESGSALRVRNDSFVSPKAVRVFMKTFSISAPYTL